MNIETYQIIVHVFLEKAKPLIQLYLDTKLEKTVNDEL